jgi:hypothetical protein
MEMSGQLHASAVLFPGKRSGTHWLGGCVGPIAYLDILEKKKIFYLCQVLNPGPFSPYPSHYRD